MSRASRIGSIILIASVLIFGLLSAALTYTYIAQRDQLQAAAFDAARQEADAASAEISEAFGELMVIAEALADELTTGALAYTDIETRMLEIVDERPDIDGLAITFEPFVYNPDIRLFQTYVYKTDDGTFDILRGATYDYTRRSDGNGDANNAWYTDTIDEGAQWHEPFFATGARKILVEYGVPFYPVDAGDDAAPAGIVSIDYTLETVRGLVDDLQLGATGYGFVLSDRGTFLAHPVAEFVVNQSINDVTEDTGLISAAQQSNGGDRDFVETMDPVTNQPTWYFFEPIGETGWTLGIVLDTTQFLTDERQQIRDQMGIALALAATIYFLLTTIFHLDRYHITNFWASSAVFSVLCVALILLAWILTNDLETHSGVSITSQSELDRYLQQIELPAGTFTQPERVPTGMLVQALQFPDPTSVTVNGYIWQRYDAEDDAPPGFSLPQRIGEEATIEEIRRETVDGETMVVWYIGVTLRQAYETVRFPFDHRNITIRIAPGDPGANIVLTPDLEAYELIKPSLLPGVDPGASINNWTLRDSRYSYAENRVDARLTLSGAGEGVHLPELRFNIQAQRVYLGAFIAYLLPGLVAAAMTFTYLVSGREPGKNDEIVNALNYAAALFFVVAVIHSALREQIAAVGVTYLEYVYILLYLAIIAVAANMFAVARFPHWSIVSYRDNLIPKVLYWPVFAGTMLFVTLAIFVW